MGSDQSKQSHALDPTIPTRYLNNPDHLFTRASAIRHGQNGFERDIPCALQIFKTTAKRFDHLESIVAAADLLLDGKHGVQKDAAAAVQLYQSAVDRHHAGAMNTLGFTLWRGTVGVRKDIQRAHNLLEAAVSTSGDPIAKIRLAKFLLSEDSYTQRDPARAALLLEDVVKISPNAFALHELAVLYETGDDGVPPNATRAAVLFEMAATQSTYSGVGITDIGHRVIAAGAQYVNEIVKIIKHAPARPKICLLLTLGGPARGKTCTINSMRGMSFVSNHVPTEMAALNKVIIEPGTRVLDEDVIAELDFNENSLRANVSRLYETESIDTRSPQNGTCTESYVPGPNADVIERVRRSLTQYNFPLGFKGSVVQVWDMAGQSEYEMAHSLFIARADILVFVTDLEKVANEATRHREVNLLCYWMQLAHFLVPDPTLVKVVVVGTRKATCGMDAQELLYILKDCMAEQLSEIVYDSWMRERSTPLEGMAPRNLVALENSQSETDPRGSGLEDLEWSIQAYADEVVSERGSVFLRWLAFVDKIEREDRTYFTRADIVELVNAFPGFDGDDARRERDVLNALRCFASTGRLVLFELSEAEWYVFTDVSKIVTLVGKVTAPERRLRNRLSAADIRRLKEGYITKKALFILWDGYREHEKEVILRLLYLYDLLVLLRGSDESGGAIELIGVPALLKSGWDDFLWGRAAGEKDLSVSTSFAEALPSGVTGRLVAYLYRILGSEGTLVNLVRADAALIEVEDGSRLFVGVKSAQRLLYWKFRGRNPVQLAHRAIALLEDFLDSRYNRSNMSFKHVIVQNCCTSMDGCGAKHSVELELSELGQLGKKTIRCSACMRRWNSDEIRSLQAGADDSKLDQSRVMPPPGIVFISHAGPDKHTVAHPLFNAFERHGIGCFFDTEGLQISRDTAPEVMIRAMENAHVGVFILSPEFAARRWPMKELRCFISRNQEKNGHSFRPVILPIFYRLNLDECTSIYDEDSSYRDLLKRSGFFDTWRQRECSVKQAAAAMREVTKYSGIEVRRLAGGEDLSSAAVVDETVRRVLTHLSMEEYSVV